MSMRNGITIALLLFVGASVVYLVAGDAIKRPGTSGAEEVGISTPAEEPAAGLAEVTDAVIVYYFHGDQRCRTCLTIESYTEEALAEAFRGELDSGRVAWRPVNIDRPENRHFIDDYELSIRTVVLVDLRHGEEQRWLKLDKVWELVHQPEDFYGYIQGNLADFLETSHG